MGSNQLFKNKVTRPTCGSGAGDGISGGLTTTVETTESGNIYVPMGQTIFSRKVRGGVMLDIRRIIIKMLRVELVFAKAMYKKLLAAQAGFGSTLTFKGMMVRGRITRQ